MSAIDVLSVASHAQEGSGHVTLAARVPVWCRTQVHVYFSAEFEDPERVEYGAGSETLEVGVFSEEDMPWDGGGVARAGIRT